MPFKRKFDASYPCVYNTWKTEDATMIIQDLAPEDDEAALKILKDDMITDEVLCNIQKVIEDPLSTQEILEFWGECLKQRMSIGCYEEKDGKKTLVALNVCIVDCEGEDEQIEFKGAKTKNVNAVMVYAEKIANSFEYTGLPILLHAMGLIVRKESRGRSFGQKILAAREPLCLSQGIKATATLFTGIGSQKLAARVGFETMTEFTIRDLAEQGLPYPKDDERVIKYMAWKFA